MINPSEDSTSTGGPRLPSSPSSGSQRHGKQGNPIGANQIESPVYPSASKSVSRPGHLTNPIISKPHYPPGGVGLQIDTNVRNSASKSSTHCPAYSPTSSSARSLSSFESFHSVADVGTKPLLRPSQGHPVAAKLPDSTKPLAIVGSQASRRLQMQEDVSASSPKKSRFARLKSVLGRSQNLSA